MVSLSTIVEKKAATDKNEAQNQLYAPRIVLIARRKLILLPNPVELLRRRTIRSIPEVGRQSTTETIDAATSGICDVTSPISI